MPTLFILHIKGERERESREERQEVHYSKKEREREGEEILKSPNNIPLLPKGEQHSMPTNG